MDTNFHTFGLDELDRWRTFYERAQRPGPYHDPEYITRITGYLGEETTAELAVLEAEGGVVYYPYLVRPVNGLEFASDESEYSDAIASWYYGGPVFSGDDSELAAEFTDRFAEYCTETGIVAEFVRFDPNLRNDESFPTLEPTFERETVWVDLEQTRDELWDGFEKRNRNAIRQAQDTAITVEPTRDPVDIGAFHEIYAEAMEAKDATEHYRFPLEFFKGLLEDETLASLLLARYEDSVIGGAMTVHDDRIAHDYLRASNPDYWDMRVNNLLCYRAMMHARDRGCSVFDFQGGRPGVFKFKKSFSPERGEFHVANRVHLPHVYDELTTAAAEAGRDTETDYFPAYRVAKSN